MTIRSVTVEELESVREQLINIVNSSWTDRDKQFLLSMKKGEPLWDLHPCMHIKDLPAVRWELENILRMEGVKKKEAFNKLEDVLYGEHR